MMNYNLSFSSEPIPETRVFIFPFYDTSYVLTVEGILDTGSPITCLPRQVMDKFDKARLDYETVLIKGAFSRVIEKDKYFLNLKLLNCHFQDIGIVEIEKPYAIIGRDVINMYKVLLDGPSRTWGAKR